MPTIHTLIAPTANPDTFGFCSSCALMTHNVVPATDAKPLDCMTTPSCQTRVISNDDRTSWRIVMFCRRFRKVHSVETL